MAERKAGQPLPFYRFAPGTATRHATESLDCVVALRALGESTRARIVGMLIDAPLDVSEISNGLGISQYNASKHLRILREAGLLELEVQGRRHLYALPDTIRRAAEAHVLDLGCCSFQFEAATAKSRKKTERTRRAAR
jgi:DNA-binding transcriptional ArsR family regulator